MTKQPTPTAPSSNDGNKRPMALVPLSFKQGRKIITINALDIFYIKAEDGLCSIITNTEEFEIRNPLSHILESLPEGIFIRVHRNYVANLSCVSGANLETQEITVGDTNVPIGRTYSAALLKAINLV